MNYLNYYQPSFYHFSDDSIYLAKIASSIFENRKSKSAISVLDLCAGCGVVGIEFVREMYHKENAAIKVSKLTLIEKNPKFLASINQNVVNLNLEEIEVEVSNTAFELYLEQRKQCFDLILCNPPFYKNDKFRASPDIDRASCRSYPAGFFKNLFHFIENSLAKEGEALLVYPTKEAEDILKFGARLLLKAGPRTGIYVFNSSSSQRMA